MTRPWYAGPLASYDCETTGIEPETDRIVTAALIRPNGDTLRWLSNADGVDVPVQASDIHGYTTDIVRSHGKPAKEVIEEIADAVAGELSAGHAALVVMNAPFDLTMLDAECTRHGVPTVAERIGRPVGPIVDPLVLDRAADRYRKGRRNLEALCAHYGVTLTNAHSADADAKAALDVALAIGRQYPELEAPAEALHAWQVTWHARWAAGYAAHLSARGNKPVSIPAEWPVRPLPEAVTS
ncbi:exonuclease domain-containing protein [Actinacidiphila sp. ITFR-21]|uniref:exonuclease domain-containing protein n=1 Tax=Actinacidiphila sp. ITFR-21 TaxID=3075199 RepID=UPI00288A67E1|nr:exonuclease domain-containing protein [Streptomyces sp. ITFR-21]WNI19131.1 exonuclease domain-containing protein [Streptomyces sp. ITFR-21]